MLLTAEQAAVVAADCDGPRLVDAGAGTGKTFTIIERARALIEQGFAPDGLLIVTYTKAAASEIAERLERVLDPADLRRPTCGTFHSLAGDLLREFAYAAGIAPGLRVIDDIRARGIFLKAFHDLEASRLACDLQSFPLLGGTALARSLASIALSLKAKGTDIATFRERALAQADLLSETTFGAIAKIGKKGGVLKGWPRPNPERTPDERRSEAVAERRNINVVVALFTRFQKLLNDESLLTFGDAIVQATRMLEKHPGVASRLRDRWRHAIVDEFQDTNGMQIALLEAIFGEELCPVLAVGDVRQAIYEFNGAEPGGIVRFRDERAIETLPLGENRRSVQPILDLAFHAYGTLTGADAADTRGAALRAHRGHAEPDVVRVQSFAGPDACEQEAATVAREVRHLIDKGVRPSEIALLMRSRKRAHYFVDALNERGIATRLLGGVGFFDAPEIRELVAWVQLALEPTEPYALVAALQGASVALGDGAMVLLASSGDIATAALRDDPPAALDPLAVARLHRFRASVARIVSLGDVPLVNAVRRIVAISGVELARPADTESAAQASANLKQFVALAAGFAEDRPSARLRDFLDDLHERAELDADLPLADLPGDRVTLTTIHGAKGLEWEHVFLVNVAPKAFPLEMNDSRGKVAELDASGALAIKLAVDGRPTLRWYITQYAHDAAGIFIARPRSLDEEYRLFYVAVTRARDRLTITGRLDANSNESRCLSAVKAWIATIGSDPAAHALANTAANAEPRGTLGPLPGFDAEAARQLETRLARLSLPFEAGAVRQGALSFSAMDLHDRCPRRARYQYVLGLPDLSEDGTPAWTMEGNSDHEARDPRRFGKIVHKILELDALARIGGLPRDFDAFVADAVEEEGGTESEGRDAALAARAATAALVDLTPVDAERRFDLTINGVALGGYIDLLARDAEGRLVVIDYKTGRTSSDHYSLQFALYAQAIRESDGMVPQTMLLRISDGTAQMDAVEPASGTELLAAIAAASEMTDDSPKPGSDCRYCPYAHDVCRDAAVTLAY